MRLWQMMGGGNTSKSPAELRAPHVTTQIQAIEAGAPIDLVFHSIAGTEATNAGFGVSLAILREAHEATLSLGRGTLGDKTGQGSALSAVATTCSSNCRTYREPRDGQ